MKLFNENIEVMHDYGDIKILIKIKACKIVSKEITYSTEKSHIWIILR